MIMNSDDDNDNDNDEDNDDDDEENNRRRRKRKKTQKQINTEIQLKSLIAPIYKPSDGLTIEEITKTIHQQWRFMQPDQFRRESKYIERVLGILRHEVYVNFRELVNEAMREERPRIAVASIPPPDFLPFALKQTVIYWRYFNCVRKPFTDDVEKILRARAEGLIRTADIMDEMFNPTVGYSVGGVTSGGGGGGGGDDDDALLDDVFGL